ncbi:hypothetical protein PISMIDRAFT_680805 [Pisolithus microcarpus 441]|uniref:Uncharacterized protein n=1 Tax=Pisolithus microcarpus 441 TaxID=765257 RepID=A0A0C9YZ71_9AGAM|nr:hypothetical protein PISMIDRAFT_680805 [Pisolithus microcarpus 441]
MDRMNRVTTLIASTAAFIGRRTRNIFASNFLRSSPFTEFPKKFTLPFLDLYLLHRGFSPTNRVYC